MNEMRVESATLRAVAYDDSRGVLQLEFRTRAIYHYYGVPAAVYEALLGASSMCIGAQTGLLGEG